MPQELEDVIREKKAQGMTALQIMKWLRDNFGPVQWVEVKTIYLRS